MQNSFPGRCINQHVHLCKCSCSLNCSSKTGIKVLMYSLLVDLLGISLDGVAIFCYFSQGLILNGKLKYTKASRGQTEQSVFLRVWLC